MLGRRSLVKGLVVAFALALPMASAAADKLKVVATTGMIADAARQIGGDAVDVRALMGPGVDPHGYRQTRADIVAMTRADLVLWHGLYLEAQMEGFFEKLSKKTTVVPVAEALPKNVLRGHEDYEGRYDPHVWMDPALWQNVVNEVARALTQADPEHADMFAANLEAYTQDLTALGAYAAETLTKVPEKQRVLLSAHDAFGYFGRAYGFEVIGIQGISTNSEAGLNRISELVDLLVDRKISAVFVETSVSDRNMRALIEGARAKGHEVTIGGALFSDAMGVEGTYEGTYIGMIDHNATTIAGALGAEVPAGGMSGKLGQGS